jgi:hypothetical protein
MIPSYASDNQPTDFARAFQHGASLLHPQAGECTIRVTQAGELLVPTGHLIACDPYWIHSAPMPYTTLLPTGRFPVLLSIASFARGDQRTACAQVCLSAETAVRWEMALIPDQDPHELGPGEYFGYAVDAGSGCFTDLATLAALLSKPGVRDLADWRLGPTGPHRKPDGTVTPEWHALVDAVYGWSEIFGNQLLELQSASADDIAVITDGSCAGNLIAFSSGWGDGAYPSYFGYDAKNRLASVVTDFHVLIGVE